MVAFYIILYNEHNLSIIAVTLQEHAISMVLALNFFVNHKTIIENDKLPQNFLYVPRKRKQYTQIFPQNCLKMCMIYLYNSFKGWT